MQITVDSLNNPSFSLLNKASKILFSYYNGNQYFILYDTWLDACIQEGPEGLNFVVNDNIHVCLRFIRILQ